MSELAEISKRVDSIDKRMDEQIQKKKNAMVVSVVAGVVILIIVFIYFQVIKSQLRDAMEPKSLMIMARQQAEKVIPEVTANIEKELRAQAPILAEKTSQRLIDAMPVAREYLETQMVMKTEDAMDSFIGEFDAMVTEAMQENRTVIVGYMRDMQDEVKKDQFVNDFRTSLKKHFDDPGIQTDLQAYTDVLYRMNKKVKQLYNEENMTREDELVRDIIFCMREMAKRGKEKRVEM